jgi:uncharacterized protein YndB with AHSA1/START domain
MNIRHAMIVHSRPDRVYAALTRQQDLTVWMGAPTLARPAVGATIEFQFDQGQRTLKLEVTGLAPGQQIRWRVLQPVWPGDAVDQTITWSLTPYDNSTLVDFRMTGWPEDDDIYASVSYKWASFMMRLKIYLGDTREIATFLRSGPGWASNK